MKIQFNGNYIEQIKSLRIDLEGNKNKMHVKLEVMKMNESNPKQ